MAINHLGGTPYGSKQTRKLGISQHILVPVFAAAIFGCCLQSSAATPDGFQQSAQHVVDMIKGKEGWDASRCMIPATIPRDVVTSPNNGLLKYGDLILEVADQPLAPTVSDPVTDALRKLSPTATVKLKVLRDGKELTLSVGCSDSRPMQTQIVEALSNAALGNYDACAEKLSAVESLHSLNWSLAAFRFQCEKRAGKLPTSEAQALYDVDRQAIVENAMSPAILEKLSKAILVDETALSRMGEPNLAKQIQLALETAQHSPPSQSNHAGAERDSGTRTVPDANDRTHTVDLNFGGTFDFRGLRVGGISTPAAVEQAFRDKNLSEVGAVKCGAGSQATRVCNGIAVVAGAVAYANVVIDATGRLLRISLSFPSDHFDQVIEGASEKYGKPTQSSAVAVQNRMGATFENSTLTWGNPKGDYIQASRYGDTIDKGYIYFGTAQDTALLKQAQTDSRKNGAF